MLMFVLVVTLSAATISEACNRGYNEQSPNIVIVMADDVGIDDVSYRGSNLYLTPNIDALGYHGIILNRYYAPWLCTPSRAAVLTGRYPINIGMQQSVIQNHEPWGLPEQYPTIANIFQDAGYSTALIGKWHLGSAKTEWTPTYRGFDYHYGYFGGYIDYWQRRAMIPYNKTLGVGYDFWRNLDLECADPGKYVTDLFTNEAEQLIKRHNINQPLFLMVNHLAGHAALDESLQAPQEEIDKFNYIQDPQKRIYAAMISKLDESVGRIVDALDAKEMLDNSIIIFYSDNGAPSKGLFANTGSNWPLRGQKRTPWEGGVRVAGTIWSPLLRRRSQIWQPSVHVTDWLPTLATAAGINLSKNLQLDGIDLWKALSSGKTNRMPTGRAIVHGMDEQLGATSYMRGIWKYINGTTQHTDVLMSRDPSEIDPRDEHYATTVRSSLASRSLQKFDYYPLDDNTINSLRAQAEIRCNPKGEIPQRLCDVNTPECLFRIDEDPCEQNNLASLPEYSGILHNMQQDVEWYRRRSVPPVNKRGLLQSSPGLHHCVWSMFLDEEPTKELARDIPKSGFNFENCKRNAELLRAGFKPPKTVKTGTTIAGIIFKDGVILGADTRATEGPIVSDKNCSKIHYLAKNMYCCGAGTAADTEMTTDMIASQLELHRLNTGRQVPLVAANTLLKQMLFRHQGHISAALVLGGVDKTGSYIYSIHPHGSTDKLPYTTMGSGSLAAMSIFEARWRPDLPEEEAKLLVRDAIAAGVFNDLGSGSNIDLCVIRKNSTADYLRNYELANIKGQRKLNYDFKLGTTAVLKTTVKDFDVSQDVVFIPMDTA